MKERRVKFVASKILFNFNQGRKFEKNDKKKILNTSSYVSFIFTYKLSVVQNQ